MQCGGSPRASDIRQLLWRHGVQAEIERLAKARSTDGEAIVEWTRTHGVDLVVMGAFGHSRVRELMLGGTTRDILRTSGLPMLMPH